MFDSLNGKNERRPVKFRVRFHHLLGELHVGKFYRVCNYDRVYRAILG